MTKTSLLLLALAAGAPLLAQAPGLTLSTGDSSLTLYGILDAGVGTVAHTLDFSDSFPAAVNPTLTRYGNSSATGVINGGISPTRWGIKGSTDLGGGWKGLFLLESAFNLQSGEVSNAALGLAQNFSGVPTAATAQVNNSAQTVSADSSISGQLFNRGAYVGVASDKFGQLTIGRQQSLMLDTIPGYDALQGAQLFTPIGFSGLYGGGGLTDNARVDNSLKYQIKVGDIKVAGLHKFGGVAGNSTAKGADQFLLGYERGNFGIVFVYQSFQDGTAVANPSGAATYVVATGATTTVMPIAGTVAATFSDTKNTDLVARYKVGPVWIKGGFQSIEYTNPSNPIGDKNTTSLYGQVISSWNVAPYTVTVGGVPTTVDKKVNVTWLGAAWDVTSKFNAALGYYKVHQNDYSGGTQPLGGNKIAGDATYTSVLLDYTFTKAFDAYLGYMNVSANGGLIYGAAATATASNQFLNTSNGITAVGIRYKF